VKVIPRILLIFHSAEGVTVKQLCMHSAHVHIMLQNVVSTRHLMFP